MSRAGDRKGGVKSWVEERRCQELGRGKEVSRSG